MSKSQKNSQEKEKNNKKPEERTEKIMLKDKLKKISGKTWAMIITAAVLMVAVITVSVILIVKEVKKDKNFDYLTSNLDKYISIPADKYKNYSLNIDIAKPHYDIDIDTAILSILAADRGKVLNDGALVSPATITPGDEVSIWYRGYLLGEDGSEILVDGMCNFSSTQAQTLTIGSGQFVPGFELNLSGKNTADYTKFNKISEGTVTEGQIAYVSFSRLVEGGNTSKDTEKKTAVRINFADTNLDATYGEGFKERILGATIGQEMEFSVTLNGKVYNYSKTKVDFVTDCEGKNPIVVECYFPYDYSNTILRNETAYFEVYVDGVVQYENPEFNEEYILKKVKEKGSAITEAELRTYEGDTLVDKYRSYAKEYLDKAYEENYRSMVEDAMWQHYLEIAEVKKYPQTKVDAIYKEYIDDVDYQFEQTSGSIQNQITGEYEYHDNVDDFAIAYLGLTYSENQDWKAVLRTMSEELVKERLVLYYLMDKENLIPDDSTFQTKYEAVRQEYLDEYVAQYLEYEEKTASDYTAEEYYAFVEARKKELFDYYDEDYFKETTFYEIALDNFVTWPTVSTLNDRRAYPVSQ